MHRRSFVGAITAAGLAPQIKAADTALDTKTTGGKSTAKDVTRTLARYVVAAKYEDLLAPVRKEAQRTLLNWAGCAVGGSRHETRGHRDRRAGAVRGRGAGHACSAARNELDVLHAALMNGISSHIFDYDDTHLSTIIHPAGPVASAILAFSEYQPGLGTRFSARAGAGRRGRMPHRQRRVSGALRRGLAHHGHGGRRSARRRRPASCSGLTEQQMVWALGIAATQPVGLREMFGTMTKSFHPGRAAQNGLTAAFLASRRLHQLGSGPRSQRAAGPTCSARRAITPRSRASWARRYEISLNTYKPFACGIVIHPAHRRLHPASQSIQADRGADRAHRAAGPSAGAGADRQEDAADGPGRQVQRLLRGGGGDREGRGGREAIQRRAGARSGDRRAARPRGHRRRSVHSVEDAGAGRDHAEGRPAAGEIPSTTPSAAPRIR